MIKLFDHTANDRCFVARDRITIVADASTPSKSLAEVSFVCGGSITVRDFDTVAGQLGNAFVSLTRQDGKRVQVSKSHVVHARHQRPELAVLRLTCGGTVEVRGSLDDVAALIG